jgi:hypothetical protein
MMELRDYPREIERAAQALAATVEEIADVRDLLKSWELDALETVIEARGEDQKPLYTNDKARELAVARTLKNLSTYQQDRARLRTLERKKATLEAECERLRREYRIALIDYEREQIGRRDVA